MQQDSKTTNGAKPDLYPPTSSTQRVFLELRDRIIQGDIAPGERLKVDSLKNLLNVGATPIREALSLLTSDQLVERLDQRGFRAAPASEKNFQEILSLRCQLDSIALTNSISNGDSAWEEQLVLSHHRLTQTDQKIRRIDIDKNTGTAGQGPERQHKQLNSAAQQVPLLQNQREREQLHKAFHMMLLQACDSPVLLKFCNQLYDLNIRYRFLAGNSGHYATRDVAREHAAIVAATIGRDTTTAVNALLDHYKKTGDFLIDQLDTSGAKIKSNSTSE